jgi:hypothetical protein
MLVIEQDVVGFQMTDDVAMHDMFHDLAANRSQRYWSVVGSFPSISFLK